MSNGTSKPRRAMQLGATLIAVAGLLVSLTALASAQNTTSTFYSGNITGPDFCTDRSLGGPATYPYDSNGDGVADICSLLRTRRATAARQNAMERLAGEPNLTLAFSILFSEECIKVAETFGEPVKEATDECAAPRAAQAAGRTPPAVPASPFPLDNTSATFFSGPVVTSRTFCLNRSFGGPVTYPYDSDGDGVADICSLPRTRRAAVARQNAFERLATTQVDLFFQLFAEECRRVPASFGDPIKEASDECATGGSPSGTPLPTPGSGTGGTGTPGSGTPGSNITPPRSPVATNPGTYDQRSAQNVQFDPGNGKITVRWDPPVTNPGNVLDYEVWWARSGQGWTSSQSTTTASTSVEITGLTNFTTYRVRILADRNSSSQNRYTPTLTSTPGLAGPPLWPETDPLVASGYGEITADWNAPYGSSLTVSNYVLQWSTSSGSWSATRQTTTTSTNHLIEGLTNNTTYYVRVQGVTANGPGTWSLTKSVRLSSNLQTPGQPTGLTLTTAGTGTSLTATWVEPVANPTPTHYLVQWRNVTTRENWSSTLRQNSVTSGTTTTITGLVSGNQYRVRVRAVNDKVAGSWSSEKPITLGDAAPPTNIALTLGNRQMSVTWTNTTNVPATSSLVLQWRASNQSWSSSRQATPSTTATSHGPITGLTNGTTHYVRMRSVNSNGTGPWSSEVSGIPGTSQAPTVSATPISDTSDDKRFEKLYVSWFYTSSNPPATGFQIRWKRNGTTNWGSPRNVGLAPAQYTISSLTTDTEYDVQVRTKNNNGYGPWSTTVTGTTANGKPPKPTTASVAAVTDTSDTGRFTKLKATWSAVTVLTGAPSVSQYQIRYRTVNINTNQSGILSASVTSGTKATLKITGQARDWWYKKTAPTAPAGTCTKVENSTTGNLTGLTPGTTYTYKAYSATGCGDSNMTGTATFTISTSNWSTSTSTTTSRTLTGLTNGNLYDVEVRAYNSYGYGPWSDTQNGTPTNARPSKPNPTVAEITDTTDNSRFTKLKATWSAVTVPEGAPSVNRYNIRYRKAGTTAWTTKTACSSTSACSNTTSYILTGLTTATSYEVQMQARNSYGSGPWSDTDSAAPTDGKPKVPTSVTVTDVASEGQSLKVLWSSSAHTSTHKLTAFALGDTTAILTITGHTADWWYKGNQTNASCTKVNANTTTVKLTGLTAGTTYIYKAYTDVDGDGDCDSGDTITNASATFTTEPAGKPQVSGFHIQYRVKDTNSWGSSINVGPNVSSHKLTGLTNSTAYQVRVRAWNSYGAGAWSAETEGTPTSS